MIAESTKNLSESSKITEVEEKNQDIINEEAPEIENNGGEEEEDKDEEKKVELVTVFNDPVNFNIKHPLQGSWTLWYDCASNRPAQNDWTQNLKQLITFRTVEDFWGAFNNIAKASELSTGSNYHLFREHIRPAWEDPNNSNGGRWTVQLKKGQSNLVNDCWLYSNLMVIGEASPYSEEICGVVVSVRKSFFRLSLWTKDAHNKESVLAIGRCLRQSMELHPKEALEFQPHEDATKTGVDRGSRLVV